MSRAPAVATGAGRTQAAAPPPTGLPGLDPAWSRLVRAPSADGGDRTWHVLDTGPALAEAGVVPIGTVLAVHGNPTWSYLWRSVVAASLAGAGRATGAWRVVAVDQLEMGWSERTGLPRPLPMRVRDLGLLTDTLELGGPVVTLGHDWGGVISLGWAVDHPELLAGVVVTNTAVHLPADAALPAPLRLALALARVGTVDTTAFLDTTLAIAHPPLAPDVRHAYRAPYRQAARRAGIGTFVQDIPERPGHPSRAEFDRIGAGVAGLQVPALLLWGPRDPVFGEQYLADLMRRLPHADVHRYEGAGHLVAEDADIAGAVLAWLDARLAAPVAPVAAAVPSAEPAATVDPFVPIWGEIEARSAETGPALVELAPSGRTRPRAVSWHTLWTRVAQLGAGLHRAGVRRGDRVSLLVPPGADLTAALYACLRIGAVVVVADAGLGLRGMTRAVRGARPDWVIGVPAALAVARAAGWPGTRISTVTLSAPVRAALGVRASFGELVRSGADGALPPAPAAEDPAAVLFTSGSTGPAKGVRYTHAGLAGVRNALRPTFGVDRDSGMVAGFGPFALLGPAFGCRTAVPDMSVTKPATLTATALAEAAATVSADSVFLSPAALRNVIDTAGALDERGIETLRQVRVLLSAGAPVGEPLLARASALLPNATLHTPYGMTEGLLITDVTLQEIRESAGSAGAAGGVCVGTPVPGARVRIAPLDADGRATGAATDADGVTGEILVSAPHILEGYDRLWRTDHEARAGSADDHWHRTGDVGRFDEAGRLWVEGRLPHVIVTADGVVTPVGVEQRVESAPGIRRAAAVGVGPRGTQQLVVVVETEPSAGRPGLADRALADDVRAAAGLTVAAVLVVPELPTDVRHNSKIDRSGLARWAVGVLAGGPVRRP